MELKLSTQLQEPIKGDPADLVIVSVPKMGKSQIFGAFTQEVERSIVLDLEPGGYDYVKARRLSVYPDNREERTKQSLFDRYIIYLQARDLLLKEPGKFTHLLVDNLTELEKFAEIGGTFFYMHQTTVGKYFNRSSKGVEFPYNHPEFKSVKSLPKGAGWDYIRNWFMAQIEIFNRISPYRIYAAHVADKYFGDDTENGGSVGKEISLSGKLKSIFAGRITTLCKLINSDNKRYLDFVPIDDSIVAGSRHTLLDGRILISEKDPETKEIKTYWNNIYENR